MRLNVHRIRPHDWLAVKTQKRKQRKEYFAMAALIPRAHPPDAARPPGRVLLPTHLHRPLRATYWAAGAIVLIPLCDIAPRLWPVTLLSNTWRFEAYSAVCGIVLAPLAAATLSHWVAAIDNDRPVQGTVAALSTIVGCGFVILLPIFLRDYLVLREGPMRAMQGALDGTAWRTLAFGLIGGIALIALGVSGWRSADSPPQGQIRKKGGLGGLVVGQDGEGT